MLKKVYERNEPNGEGFATKFSLITEAEKKGSSSVFT
jgi:hypothetical protein